jgi:hypothetical protein
MGSGALLGEPRSHRFAYDSRPSGLVSGVMESAASAEFLNGDVPGLPPATTRDTTSTTRCRAKATRTGARGEGRTTSRGRCHVRGKEADAKRRTEAVEDQIDELQGFLSAGLPEDPGYDFDDLKQRVAVPSFDPGSLGIAEPAPDPNVFRPAQPRGLAARMPGAEKRFAA